MSEADSRRTKAELIAELDALRAAAASGRDQSRLRQALDAVAAAVRPTTGDTFLQTLVTALTNVLHVRYAFVEEFVDANRGRLRSLAASDRGRIVTNIAYDLSGTPCERVIAGGTCIYPADVQRLFPRDVMLAEMRAESYAGVQLESAPGVPIGLLAVVHDAPLADPHLVKTVLELFGIRAGAEVARRASEAAARRAQRLASSAERVGQIGSFEWDIKANEVQWSPGMYDLYGVDPATAPSITFEFAMSFVNADDAVRIEEQVRDAFAARGRVEVSYRITRPDGTRRLLWGQSELERDADGQPAFLVGTVHDWTDRQASDLALRQSEERYRALVESVSFGIYRSTREGRLVAANPALVAMLGYESPEELFALNLATDVYRDPAQRDAIIRSIPSDGSIVPVIAEWKRRDGTPIVVRLSGRMSVDRDGREGYTVTAEDVTAQQQLEQQLRQAQKMEGIGRLAGGVAHDFNNILTAITSYADLLLTDTKFSEEHRADVSEIKTAAGRAAALTRQLLAFSRQQVLAPRVLDLNAVVSGMDKMLSRIIGEDITLTTRLGATGHVRADPAQIEQVLMNLVVNARDAVRSGAEVVVTTEDRDVATAPAGTTVPIGPGSYVVLAVSDTGTGMDPDTLARAFDPFFTTKPPGLGTGLGLSTVYGIVKQSGGYVIAQSAPGRGTTVEVYLPSVTATTEWPLPAMGPHRKHTGSETVLLVEDDPGVRRAASLALAQAGYHVVETGNPLEAVDLARRHAGTLDLLFTDVVMPGMGGRELCAEIRRELPGLPVLYMSGYPGDPATRDRLLEPGAPFLSKPFTAAALAEAVRTAIDGANTGEHPAARGAG